MPFGELQHHSMKPNREYSFTIAFYNLENLFDTVDNPFTNDDEFTPWSAKKWTRKRLKGKLRKLATTIARIGDAFSARPPVILGVSEVENPFLLEELISQPQLQAMGYRFIHFHSPDSRGMDNALLYMDWAFQPLSTDVLPVRYEDEHGEWESSRDILFVEGLLLGERVSIYVNHWPSRREGVNATRYRREAAAGVLLNHMLGHQDLSPQADAKIVVMGDLNDRPRDSAPRMLTASGLLRNPFDPLAGKGRGTVSHRGAWYLFDQILLSPGFFRAEGQSFAYAAARIYNAKFLGQYRGRFKGHPFRTYAGLRYKGGYSDHFPVYIQFDSLLNLKKLAGVSQASTGDLGDT